MFNLHAATDVAFSNILGNFSLHASPPEFAAEVLVHLGATRVDGYGRLMCFLEYQPLGISPLGHHKTVRKINNTGVINGETLSLPTCDIRFDLSDASIMLLGCLDFILKSGFDLQVS